LGRFIKWVKQIHRVSSDGSHKDAQQAISPVTTILEREKGGRIHLWVRRQSPKARASQPEEISSKEMCPAG